MKPKNIFNRKFFELTGCLHNHTEYSYDCSVTLKKVISAARKNNLDYLTINDHRTKAALKDSYLKSEKDIFVIVGAEINDPDNSNHTLLFNSDRIITDADAEYYTSEYQKENAVTFAAHPIEKRRTKEFRKYEWTDLENSKFTGIEIWNYMSQWIGQVHPKLNGLILILFPNIAVRKPYKAIVEHWDKLNLTSPKSAIGSVDAHEQHYKFMGINLRFLGHKYLFSTIRTNVLIAEDKEIDQKNIINALALGNSYIVNYRCGNPYNFFAGISDNSSEAIFGETIAFTENLKFYYRLPDLCNVKLLCNGKLVAKQHGDKGFFKIDKPGNYRLEIFKNWKGWIFTNNIYIKKLF